MFTSLYLMYVLPGSRPAASLNTIVMVGPSLSTRCTARPTATSAASNGMIQMIEIRVRLPEATVASGNSSSRLLSTMLVPPGSRCGRIPDKRRVEGPCREHRQHHDCPEEDDPWARLHRHQGLELHERDRERGDEHVEHRPAADELDEPVETDAVTEVPERAALHRDQQVGQSDQLAEWDHYARHQHDEREVPRSRAVEQEHAAHDRVLLGRAERGRDEDGEGVRRDVADGGGDYEGPRVLDRVMVPHLELGAAAGTVPRLSWLGEPREQPADLARDQPGLGGRAHGRRHRSAHSTRFQSSAGSKVAPIAASRTIITPTAYIPTPGSTVANSAILISATRMPRIMTSLIDHGCTDVAQGSSLPTQRGAGGRRPAIRIASMNPM